LRKCIAFKADSFQEKMEVHKQEGFIQRNFGGKRGVRGAGGGASFFAVSIRLESWEKKTGAFEKKKKHGGNGGAISKRSQFSALGEKKKPIGN